MIAPPAVAAVCGALVAARIDARSGRIPDRVTRPTTAIALGLAIACGIAVSAFWGALAVGGTLLLLHAITRGRGLGLGDVKLGTAIGTGLGPAIGLAALGSAFVLGGAYATLLLATRRASRRDTVPFGPFLAAGTVLAALLSWRLVA
jgi:leader peptidase (prepilin peptidase) / N-methyltransferase